MVILVEIAQPHWAPTRQKLQNKEDPTNMALIRLTCFRFPYFVLVICTARKGSSIYGFE